MQNQPLGIVECARQALLVAFLLAFASNAHAQERTRYDLRATLDAQAHEVTGDLDLRFCNPSPRALPDLIFHLYPNAFRDGSVFMEGSHGALRGVHQDTSGGIRIERMTIDALDVTNRIAPQPITHDETQARVELASPLAPGACVRIEAHFVTTLPKLFARSGYAGDFHIIAQWFPKLAALDAHGEWVSFPYYAFGEFFADFADYTLNVRVPSRWQAVLPGAPQKVDDEVQSTISNVHDVAWVTAPRLVSLEAERHGVQMRFYAPPEERDILELVRKSTLDAFDYFEARYGAYGWPTLTVVLPPLAAEGGAAMEYPSMFMARTSPIRGDWFGVHDTQLTVAHELAHQWFYGMVATNEVAHPMLDEGITSWASNDYVQSRDGLASVLGVRISAFDIDWLTTHELAPNASSSLLGADQYASALDYSAAVYARPSLALEALAQHCGRQSVHQALAQYVRTHRFAHPTPDDFFTALGTACPAAATLSTTLTSDAPTPLSNAPIFRVRTPTRTIIATAVKLAPYTLHIVLSLLALAAVAAVISRVARRRLIIFVAACIFGAFAGAIVASQTLLAGAPRATTWTYAFIVVTVVPVIFSIIISAAVRKYQSSR